MRCRHSGLGKRFAHLFPSQDVGSSRAEKRKTGRGRYLSLPEGGRSGSGFEAAQRITAGTCCTPPKPLPRTSLVSADAAVHPCGTSGVIGEAEASPYGIEAADGRFLCPGGRNWCTVPTTSPTIPPIRAIPG